MMIRYKGLLIDIAEKKRKGINSSNSISKISNCYFFSQKFDWKGKITICFSSLKRGFTFIEVAMFGSFKEKSKANSLKLKLICRFIVAQVFVIHQK